MGGHKSKLITHLGNQIFRDKIERGRLPGFGNHAVRQKTRFICHVDGIRCLVIIRVKTFSKLAPNQADNKEELDVIGWNIADVEKIKENPPNLPVYMIFICADTSAMYGNWLSRLQERTEFYGAVFPLHHTIRGRSCEWFSKTQLKNLEKISKSDAEELKRLTILNRNPQGVKDLFLND